MEKFQVSSIFKSRMKTIPAVPERVWQDPLYFIGFGFGSGAMPVAPGTFGTLLAIPFYLGLRDLSLPLYIGFVVLFILFSIYVCERLSRDLKVHDHPGMCIDEFAGFFVTMINAPHGLLWVVLGFLLFRFFDIVKPWPISFLDQHVHGGFGMVIDDVAAGIFSFIVIQFTAQLTNLYP